MISHVNGTSDFTFNFATAWFPAPPGGSSGDTEGLVVRVVECNPDHHPCPNVSHPEWSNAGAVTIVPASLPADGPLTTAHITAELVSWNGATPPPHSNTSKWGAADPRIVYREKDETYYLTWDNCTQNCYPHRITYLSTTKNPHDKKGWTFHGEVFPFPYTSGASLLFRDGAGDHGPQLAFVCNSNTANQILLAESADGFKWELPKDPSKKVFMAGRPSCWDKDGVASGAQPERLSNGDYLYFYNIDTGFPYKPNPLGRCAIGWAILDGNDPTTIVARSEDALLVASEPWETCAAVGKGYVRPQPPPPPPKKKTGGGLGGGGVGAGEGGGGGGLPSASF